MEEIKAKVQNLIFSKNFEEAVSYIKEDMKSNKDSYLHYELLSKVYWNKRDFKGSIASLKTATELNPEAFWLFNRLGKLNYRQKNYQEAKRCFQETLAIAPEHPVALRDLANLERIDNNIDLSNKYYRETMDIQLKKGIVNRTTILQQFIHKHKYQTYLEIGVHTGVNFFQIDAPYKVAIDPKFLIFGDKKTNNPNEQFYEVTSDEYFNNDYVNVVKERKINGALVDGLHTYEQSKKDVLNVLELLTDNGIIIMHDCYPENEAASNPDMQAAIKTPGFSGAWMGDVWKTIVWLRSNRPDLNVVTLNTDCGLGIVMKGAQKNSLNFTDSEIDSMGYEDLIKHGPEKLLGLTDPKSFVEDYNLFS